MELACSCATSFCTSLSWYLSTYWNSASQVEEAHGVKLSLQRLEGS